MATRTRLPARFTAPVLTLAAASLLTFPAGPAHAADSPGPSINLIADVQVDIDAVITINKKYTK
jgi:hypothetical protein